MKLFIGQKMFRVASFVEASDTYRERRKLSGEGASTFPEGKVRDDAGVVIARVSYNGKVWPPVEWSNGLRPIFDPYSTVAS